MLIKIKISALKNTKPHEYILRFVLGGLATACAGLIADMFGPATGGLFLAFPAIFCASATLVEKHERERKEKKGLDGARRGQEAAALDSLGVALGSFGLLAFGAIMWKFLGMTTPACAFIAAGIAWLFISSCLWWGRRSI